MVLPADVDLVDAEKLKIKTGLVIEISRAINRLKLTQHEAAKRMGIVKSLCDRQKLK
jgi:predicted XRE-type DNA-binding protein